MKTTIVEYKVKPGEGAANEALVRRVYEELRASAPHGFHYATFVLDDGVRFVHVASSEAADGENPLQELAAFRDFQAGIGERCEEPPAPAPAREIGSYAYWGGHG